MWEYCIRWKSTPVGLQITGTIGDTILETDKGMVNRAIVDKKRSEKQAKTVLHLVGHHGVGSVHEQTLNQTLSQRGKHVNPRLIQRAGSVQSRQ